MQTLAPPIPSDPALSNPLLSEQVVPGNVTVDEEEGKIGGGGPSGGSEQKPLQGGSSSDDPPPEVGSEGDGP
jgi:hypothetical protein